MKKICIILLTVLCTITIYGQKPIIAIYVVSDNSDNSETKAIKKVLEKSREQATLNHL